MTGHDMSYQLRSVSSTPPARVSDSAAYGKEAVLKSWRKRSQSREQGLTPSRRSISICQTRA